MPLESNCLPLEFPPDTNPLSNPRLDEMQNAAQDNWKRIEARLAFKEKRIDVLMKSLTEKLEEVQKVLDHKEEEAVNVPQATPAGPTTAPAIPSVAPIPTLQPALPPFANNPFLMSLPSRYLEVEILRACTFLRETRGSDFRPHWQGFSGIRLYYAMGGTKHTNLKREEVEEAVDASASYVIGTGTYGGLTFGTPGEPNPPWTVERLFALKLAAATTNTAPMSAIRAHYIGRDMMGLNAPRHRGRRRRGRRNAVGNGRQYT